MFIQSGELTAAPGKGGELGPMVTQMRDILSSETGKQWWSWAALAGRWHDLGKYRPAFQRYIRNAVGLDAQDAHIEGKSNRPFHRRHAEVIDWHSVRTMLWPDFPAVQD